MLNYEYKMLNYVECSSLMKRGQVVLLLFEKL